MKLPRPRFTLRRIMIVVAVMAVPLAICVQWFDPVRRWHRAVTDDQDGAARWEAASRAIKGQVSGLERSEAIEALCRAMSDPSRRVRETATATLGGLRGREATPAVSHLVLALKDADTTIRLRAAESLGSIYSPEDDPLRVAVPALLGALKDPSEDVRIAAGFSLTLMGRGESAIPIMADVVRQGRDRDGYAALSLGLCGSREEAAVEALERAAPGSSSSLVRRAASEALNRLHAHVPQSEP
jgi:hypothetical protein